MTERCETCRFVTTLDGAQYLCRRYPPRMEPINPEEDTADRFPTVYSDDWCGEYAPAKTGGTDE